METATLPEPLTIPSDLLAQIQAEAQDKHIPADEVLRDVIERGLGGRHWQAHAEEERQRARELGIHEAADELPITDEYRHTLRENIAQGLASARQGKLVDGAIFMARMDAELAELEAHSLQGRS
jgi:hypothetical protein